MFLQNKSPHSWIRFTGAEELLENVRLFAQASLSKLNIFIWSVGLHLEPRQAGRRAEECILSNN